MRERLDRLRAEKDGDWRRELEKRLKDILRELESELGEVRVIEMDELRFDGDFLEADADDRRVRVRIRER